MNELYNPNIKEQFLKTYDNEQTQNTIKYLLYKAYSIEKILDKDLYNFSLGEVGQVLLNSDPLNLSVAKTNARFLTQYISWGIENGLRNDNLNPLRGIDVNEWASKFVSKKKIYFSETEILELENQLVNYQDKAIIRLLFESANGHGVSEILNLKESDIDRDNLRLKLNDSKYESREIEISRYCMDLIIGASSEKEYMVQNGTKTTGTKELKLAENDFVIRTAARKLKDELAPADKHTVYRRLANIAALFDLPYLTVKNIHRSGMIKMAKDKYLEHGSLEYEQLSEIAQAFGLRTVQVNGYETFNTTILREYLNLENIVELYPEIEVNK